MSFHRPAALPPPISTDRHHSSGHRIVLSGECPGSPPSVTLRSRPFRRLRAAATDALRCHSPMRPCGPLIIPRPSALPIPRLPIVPRSSLPSLHWLRHAPLPRAAFQPLASLSSAWLSIDLSGSGLETRVDSGSARRSFLHSVAMGSRCSLARPLSLVASTRVGRRASGSTSCSGDRYPPLKGSRSSAGMRSNDRFDVSS